MRLSKQFDTLTELSCLYYKIINGITQGDIMKYGYRVLFLFLFVLSVLIHPLWAEEWSYTSADGIEVKIVGKGMGNRDLIMQNPQTLSLPADPDQVFNILTQTTAKSWNNMPNPDSVVVTTAFERQVLNTPTLISPGEGLVYEQWLEPVGTIMSQIYGGGTVDYKVPRSFVAYYFMQTGQPHSVAGRTFNHSLWWDADDRPAQATEILAIPTSGQSRDVSVTFVISDIDSHTDRNVVLEAEAGGILIRDTVSQGNRGDELLIKTLVIPDVDGAVDQVTTTVSSPEGEGDSVFWTGVQVDITTQQVDFGDAPDHLSSDFHTQIVNNGARHRIEEGFYLGYSVDSDANGQPDPAAEGDDQDGNDDEDGIIFPADVFIQGSTVEITAIASADGGFLNGWLDINGDRDWDDEYEHIIVDAPLNAGNNTLQFDIPAINQLNIASFARFRFSRERGLGYQGEAPDGEVEDYLISILYPIELSLFTAESTEKGVLLKWRTESETENQGFNLYRRAEDEETFTRITDEMIPGQGSSQSRHEYSYLDYDIQSGKTYSYKLGHVDYSGHIAFSDPIQIQQGSIKEFVLNPNYPNPFNPRTTISFYLRTAQHTTIDIYDVFGRKVRTLVSETLPAGEHEIIWDGRDDRGRKLASGTYLLKFVLPSEILQRKMTLIK